MAKGKTSFVLYSDSKSIIDLMTNEQAGLLLKTLFAYVNDENPIIDNSIAIVFEMIKLQLKRDLVKWEQTKEGRSAAGKASAEAKRLAKLNQQTSTNSTNVNFVQQTSTKSTVSDSVSVTDSVTDIIIKPKKFNFKKSLIDYGFKESLVDDWLVVRKGKRASNTQTSFNSFITMVEKNKCDINILLEYVINKSWSGFNWEWVENNNDMSLFVKQDKQIKPLYITESGLPIVKTPF
jgi:hypothetical protein